MNNYTTTSGHQNITIKIISSPVSLVSINTSSIKS